MTSQPSKKYILVEILNDSTNGTILEPGKLLLDSRGTLSKFRNFKIGRTKFLSSIKSIDLVIVGL